MEVTFDGADDGRVAPALAIALGARVVRGRARNGYGRAEVVQRGEDVLATVYGGSARQGEVHITTTSTACDEVVPIVRRLWPVHRVSRVDSAMDFLADFDELDAIAVAFARDAGLRYSLIVNSEGGATRTLGSLKSEVFLRLYKKSEQLLALHPDQADVIPPGVIRAELVAKPGKRDVREQVATMTASEVWGLSGWGREFAQAVLDFDPPRTSTHFRRPSDWARSVHFLGVQYGPLVRARAEEHGAADALREVLAVLGFAAADVQLPGQTS